jgi:hypothetical protein
MNCPLFQNKTEANCIFVYVVSRANIDFRVKYKDTVVINTLGFVKVGHRLLL